MKRILRALSIVAAVLVVAALALPFLVDANSFKPALESHLTAALGREIHLGDLKLSIFSGGVTANDLSIADDAAFSKSPFVRAKKLSVGVDLIPLIFSKQLTVTGITIDQPEVNLLQSAEGDWNFSTLGGHPQPAPQAKSAPAPTAAPAESRPMDLSVKLVRITNGRLMIGTAHGKAQQKQLEKLDIELRDFSAGSSFPFSLAASVVGGGDIKLKGTAGPIPTDAAATPFNASLTINGLDVARSGFSPPGSGIAGLMSVDGNAASNGNLITIKGKLKAENLKIVERGSPAKRPVELDLAIAHDMRKRGGTVERSAVRIGKAEAHVGGVYSLTGETPSIKMKLDGPKMPLTEIAAILPALDVVLPGGSSIEGGTATAQFSSDGPLDRLVTTGSLSIDKTRLANYDLGSKMKLLSQLAGLPGSVNTDIDLLGASVTAGPEGTDVRDINLVVPAIGTLTGAGTINPKHALDFKMRATLHTSGGLVATALGTKGDTGVPFLIQGTSENPAFKADVRSMAGEIAKDPGKAIDTARGILDMFKKKP